MIKSLEKSQAHHAKRNINYKYGGKHRKIPTLRHVGVNGLRVQTTCNWALSLWVSQKCLTQGGAPGSR